MSSNTDNNTTTTTTATPPSTDVAVESMEQSSLRYLGYLGRLKTAIVAGARYLAYTSDVGEAFRPIVHPMIVRAGYGISWAYVIGDVGLQTYREKEKGSSTNTVIRTATKTAIFQSTASMILPMITIHQTVHLVSAVLKKVGYKSKVIPTISGLAVIPALPFMFDHPVEHFVDTVYDKYWPVEKDSHAEKEKQH